MKIYLSKATVRELVLMLDDAYQVDDGEDACYDYISIMLNLLTANANRDQDNKLELATDTVDWIFSVLDTLLFNDKPRHKLSNKSRKALNARRAN